MKQSNLQKEMLESLDKKSKEKTEAEKEQILAAYEERSSLRGLERVFGVSRKTVSAWLKKKKMHSPT